MNFISGVINHHKKIAEEKHALADLLASCGDKFPGSDFHPSNRKTWMSELDLSRLRLNQIVWPGTHDSATNDIGVPLVTRPFAECQTLSIYDQLVLGARAFDVRIQHDHRVCHGILPSYNVDVVLDDIKRFLSETESELVLLEIRTEYQKEDPPEFEKYLVEHLGDHLISQDEAAFTKPVTELLPRRVICVWKPQKAPAPAAGSPLWKGEQLKDNWIDTDLPKNKFDSNLTHLGQQPAASDRRFFYRVEHTVTPNAENPVVWEVAKEIRGFARLFVSQACAKGFGNRLQVFSTDFIEEDFVDACVGLTHARLEGQA